MNVDKFTNRNDGICFYTFETKDKRAEFKKDLANRNIVKFHNKPYWGDGTNINHKILPYPKGSNFDIRNTWGYTIYLLHILNFNETGFYVENFVTDSGLRFNEESALYYYLKIDISAQKLKKYRKIIFYKLDESYNRLSKKNSFDLVSLSSGCQYYIDTELGNYGEKFLMKDIDDSELKKEIDDIMNNVSNIMKNIELLDPYKKEDDPEDEEKFK